ncbi:MAG: tetratricopeptide repeat protein [Woeseiaceae bacterium]
MAGGSIFTELRKRKVVRVAAIYGAVAWGLTEVVVTIVQHLFLPQWVSTLAVIGFVVGFPVAMFLSWTFDITSDGIQRTDVTSRRGTTSIALSMVLLVAGTAGLFLLIRPSLEGTVSRLDIPANSVAVLPFENAGQDAGDDYLSEGLSDELRGQLGRVAELRLAARSSSVAALERGTDAIETSENLRVAHIVEGSIRRQGNRLRVSVQLIEGRTGLANWSETYERGASELLVVQQTIADEIVRRILPQGEDVVTAPATRDADANELMLLAHFYEQKVRSRSLVDNETLLEAVRLYRQATEADPESALAHSRLAGALLYLGDLEAAEAPINRALLLDPNLSEVQNTLGEFYWARGLENARPAFERALDLNPHNVDALHNYASLSWLNVETEEGADAPAQLYRRALNLDPLSVSRHVALGDYLGKMGRVDEVRAVIGNIETLFDDSESYRVVAWLYELIGDVDLAIGWTLRARDLEPDNLDHVEKLADLYALIGDAETALRIVPSPSLGVLYQLRRYAELINNAEFLMIDEPFNVEVRYVLALAYDATGAFESSIHVLSSTGLPDSIFNGTTRSVSEIEAFMTLSNALVASGLPEAVELGLSLATWNEDEAPWYGDIGWVALYRSCNRAILGRDKDALELLPRMKESRRLAPISVLRDSSCFREYAEEPVYLDVLRDQEERRARLREKLPRTLAEFGVELWPESGD